MSGGLVKPRHWGRVLTAMVTPFDATGRLDLDAGKVTYCGWTSRTGHKISIWESSGDSSIQLLTANRFRAFGT